MATLRRCGFTNVEVKSEPTAKLGKRISGSVACVTQHKEKVKIQKKDLTLRFVNTA
jgi:hypothetical protein